jgi:PAS domain S-box-containing protein
MGKTSVLVVEDEAIIALNIENTLKGLGYSVVGRVSKGEDAIKKAEKLKPNLVLMDIKLKGKMNGIEAAKEIQPRFDIPVIYLTAYYDKKTVDEAEESGAYGFLTKPLESQALNAAVKTALHRHNIDMRLKESELRFRKLLEATVEGIIVHDNGVVVDVNPAFEKMFGHTRSELVGMNAFDLVAEESLDITKKMVASGSEEPYEAVGVKKDGSSIILEIRGKAGIFDGHPVRFSAVQDITDRKKEEEKLQYFQRAVEGASDAIGMSTPEGRHYYQNEAFTELFGLSVEEVDGKAGPPSTVYVDEKIGREVFTTIMGGDSWIGEVEMLDNDGKKISILLRAYPIKNEKDKIVGLVGVHTDITERKKNEKDLTQRAEELAALLKASQGLATTLELESVLQVSINEAVEVTGLGTGAIYLLEGESLRLGATTPPLPEDFPEELRYISIADHPHIMKSIKSRRPLIMDDTANTDLTPAEQEVTKLRGLRTLLYVPLIGEDKVLGVFIVGSVGEPCVISEDMINLSLTLANQSALAVQNAQLYEETKKTEEALRESEEKYSTLVEKAIDGIVIIQEGIFCFTNRSFSKMIRYSEKELLEKNFIELVVPEQREIVIKRYKDRLQGKEVPKNYQVKAVCKDGTLKDFELSVEVISYKGRPATMAMIHDITESKQAEKKIEEAHQSLLTILDGINALVYVTDMESYELLFVNKFGRDVWGDIIGKICWQTMQTNQTGPCDFCTNKYLVDSKGNAKEPYIWEFQNTVNGRWYYISDRAIKWVNGRLVRLEIATDVTDKKEAEEKLHQKIEELEKWQRLTVGREVRMSELKKEIKELKKTRK